MPVGLWSLGCGVAAELASKVALTHMTGCVVLCRAQRMLSNTCSILEGASDTRLAPSASCG